MSEYDYSSLYAQYPGIIEDMPKEFTSHEFILKLAQSNQQQYIEALYHYRDRTHRDVTAPFMIVHGILAKGLTKFSTHVEYIGEVRSTDIFGQPNECSNWRRIT